MRRLKLLFLVALACELGGDVGAQTSDLSASLKSFSDFQQVDVGKLLGGDILSERGALMKLRTGISTQTCFAVPASPAETAKQLQCWDPLPHQSLGVYQFHSMQTPPAAADFNSLDLSLNERAVRYLLGKTLTIGPGDTDLHLSSDERRQFMTGLKRNSTAKEAAACWTKLLMARAALFQTKGFDGVPAYESAGGTVSPADQLRLMLKEKGEIVREFDPLIQKIRLAGGGAPTLTPFHYWSLFSSEGYGTLNLGAVYLLPVGDRYQLLDVEYYVSGSYYASVTFYEVWPARAGEKTGSVVWRGDFFSAPGLAHTKGMERIAYGAIMLLEIKKEIRAFQDDMKTLR